MPSNEEHQFTSISINKVGALISQQLLKAIFSGRYQVGEQLPPERDLAVMFNTSRVAVREALGGLIAKGILSTRHGSGTKVNPIEEWNTLDPVILMLRDGSNTFDQLQEVRRIIEPELCALCAERITPEELENLRSLTELPLTDTIEQHVERDTSFHLAIAKSTKNTVLLIVLSSISDILKEGRRRSFLVPGELNEARQWHLKIFSAIEKHDVAGARKAMIDHMAQVQRSLDGFKSETNKHQTDKSE